MDVIINNPPAQATVPQVYAAPGYGAPYGYAQGSYAQGGYAQGYGPGYGGHPGGGFGFILLALLGVFIFLRWRRGGRGRGGGRRWALGGGPDSNPGNSGSSSGGSSGSSTAAGQGSGDWRPPRFPWARDSAADIARERFARGEINAGELSGILRALDGGPEAQHQDRQDR